MRTFLTVGAILVLMMTIVGAKEPNPEYDSHWEFFKATHGKSYKTAEEELKRREIFDNNVAFIFKHNHKHAEADGFRLGINQFADLTNDEFRGIYNGYKGRSVASGTILSNTIDVKDLPASVDWREKGYVTPVKNQGSCGSCWAFSTTGSLEGAHFKKSGKLVSLSEQNLVDCSNAEGNQGCNGGLMDQAFAYIKENNGIDTEDSYPYQGENEKCAFKKDSVGATLNSWVDIKMGDEAALQQAVATVGPVSVAIDASSIFFQFYFGGIFNLPWCSSKSLDHGVLVAGYGATTSGKPYWLVKNSWGSSWGEYGYIRMSRNKKNQCGIATNASYPIV